MNDLDTSCYTYSFVKHVEWFLSVFDNYNIGDYTISDSSNEFNDIVSLRLQKDNREVFINIYDDGDLSVLLNNLNDSEKSDSWITDMSTSNVYETLRKVKQFINNYQ